MSQINSPENNHQNKRKKDIDNKPTPKIIKLFNKLLTISKKDLETDNNPSQKKEKNTEKDPSSKNTEKETIAIDPKDFLHYFRKEGIGTLLLFVFCVYAKEEFSCGNRELLYKILSLSKNERGCQKESALPLQTS